jgi:hypothetical protein
MAVNGTEQARQEGSDRVGGMALVVERAVL